MYFSVFLLVLSFNHINFVSSDKGNSTEDEECTLCNLSFFRRKRALPEYTRWRATTQEFIVKVLEDDVTTPQTKQIVAVNIKPNRKIEEKIIVGATLLPTAVPITTPLSDEYTRFIPPTTSKITRYDDMVFAPATTGVIPPIKPKSKVRKGEQHIGPIIKFTGDRHGLRDESPPSGPKFIPRTNTEYLSQYAPIAPILFTQKTTFGPLTPRTVEKFVIYKTSVRPSRTTQLLDYITPERTPDFLNILGLADNKRKPFVFSPTRTSTFPNDTSTMITFIDENDDLVQTKSNVDDTYRRTYEEKKTTEKDTDEFYNNLMMYDDDTDVTTRKVYHGFSDTYEDSSEKSKEPDTTETTIELSSDLEEYDNTTEKMVYHDEDDVQKGTTTGTLTTRNTEEVSLKATTFARVVENNTKRVCNLLKLRHLSFSSPRTLYEITTQLKQWAEESPVAKWVDVTNGNFTVMENPIYMMIVDDPSSGQIMSAKQTVMIVAGIQGRDHHAVAAAMYVLYQLIERTDAHSDLLVKYRFWIIPVFNPDGYDYSMTFPRRREWTKNLRQTWDSCKGRDTCEACELYGVMCTIQPCYGVNLDRNFEYQWIPPEELRSEHPCGQLYAGSRQLSEAETRALTNFLHEQKTPLYTFIAFKEGNVLGIMYPYSHTRKRRAFDHVYRQRASIAASAAFSISGRPYAAGQTSEFLPLYAGGIEDWVDGHLGIDNTYTIMIFRPSDSYNSKILTERVVHEGFAAVDTLLLQSTGPLGPPPVTLSRSKAVKLQPTSETFLVLCINFVIFLCKS
ncbi:uncharacterized protein LOC123715789 isoform X1 [Pieris brassicae]|uniref:uncharacterized protein LOC123715789 isoform X1 n=1 Tax=Pieris brassicae TaxID=7116 RepID=UPI001E66162A|nr:uncharacterized protein LOC123715789 isoform X1 [Pieris brassicae]